MSDIIDLKDVLERVQDDKELLLELLDIFQEDFVDKRKALGQAVQSNDLANIKLIAHSLKGSSGNISAKPIHASCLKIEQLLKENKINSVSAVLSEIDGQFAQLKQYAVELKQKFNLPDQRKT